MAVTSITVVAPDAAPNAAPNKISNRAGHSRATLQIVLADMPLVPHDGLVPSDELTPDALHYGAVRVTPGARNLTAVASRGLVAGLKQVCGWERSLRAGGFTINDDVRFSEMGGLPDGDYNMAVNLRTEEGWS